MKRLIISIIWIINSPILWAQNQEFFKVLYLNGNLFNQTIGKNVNIGDLVNETDSISFQESTTCYLANGTQKFILKPRKTGRNIIKKTIRPILQRKMITMRGSDKETDTYSDFKAFFGEDSFLIWDTILQFRIDSLTFYNPKDTRFFISFSTLTKSLNSIPIFIEKGVATVKLNKFFLETDSTFNVTLNQINLATAVIETKLKFSIQVKDRIKLQNEIKLVVPLINGHEDERRTEIETYLFEMYGNFDIRKLESLLHFQ